MSPLIAAIRGRHLDLVEFLIKQGADVHTQKTDWGAGGPIHDAALLGDYEICELLIKSGVDVNEPDSQDHTAMFYAIEGGWEKVATLLWEHGAKVSGDDGKQYVEKAAFHNRTEIAIKLLTWGAHVAYNKDGGLILSSSANRADINAAIRAAEAAQNQGFGLEQPQPSQPPPRTPRVKGDGKYADKSRDKSLRKKVNKSRSTSKAGPSKQPPRS